MEHALMEATQEWVWAYTYYSKLHAGTYMEHALMAEQNQICGWRKVMKNSDGWVTIQTIDTIF